MRFKLNLLDRSFRAATEEKLGPLEANEKKPLSNRLIDCSEGRFSDALFVVKRNHYEAGLCQPHVMDTDEFDLRWGVIFNGSKKAPRHRVKFANKVLITSMYGSEVAEGMRAKDFDPYMAISFLNCIADLSDKVKIDRSILTQVFERSLEIYPAFERQERMSAELQSKPSGQKMKI